MPKVADLVGQRYGRLTVTALADRGKSGANRWGCRCDCGNEIITFGGNLRSGHTRSCGCLTADLNRDRLQTHGKSHSPEYGVWEGIKSRCLNSKVNSYQDYGHRGIGVCDRWLQSFENFFEDMGPRPKNYTIERLDNSRGYELSNCIWASRATQSKNKRNNVMIELNGKTMRIADWSRELGLNGRTIKTRLVRGWSAEKALLTPPSLKFRRKR